MAGLGEIGGPILQLISKGTIVIGYDINPKLAKKQNKKFEPLKTKLLHICIPFNKKFEKNVISLHKKYRPQGIVIHSTISPGTTKTIQSKLSVPLIYSATRGLHKRMLFDLKRYTKFYSIEKNAPKAKWATSEYEKLLKKCGVIAEPTIDELGRLAADLLTAAPFAVFVTDEEARIMWVNPAFVEITGFTPEEVLGKNPRLLSSGHGAVARICPLM